MINEHHPQIRALAQEAAREIKALTNAHNERIESIYRRFRAQAAAIQTEASTADMDSPGADSVPQTEQTI